MSRAKDAWVEEAKAMPIAQVIRILGLNLKKESVHSMCGPCPACGGRDRMWVNVTRNFFGCRQCGAGGDGIALVKHVEGRDFIGACERIVGRAKPKGRWEELSPEQYEERKRSIEALNAKQARLKEIEQRRRIDSARNIWMDSGPLGGVGNVYLKSRGIDPNFADDQIRFHTGLPHPEGGSFPAIVSRVCNADGQGTGVWREYLKHDGSGKAPVNASKLGLGIAAGSAVRIGGIWPSVCLAEGVLTALAVRELVGNGIPVWACLSTVGLKAVVLPPEIERVDIYADGDPPKAPKGGREKWMPSPGITAANELKARLESEGRAVTVQIPTLGTDWLDVLVAMKKKTEAA